MSQNKNENVLGVVSSTYEAVLECRVSFDKLQKILDELIIEDLLPISIDKSLISKLYKLQTQLELLAEHQSTRIGTDAYYSKEQISDILREKFGMHLEFG